MKFIEWPESGKFIPLRDGWVVRSVSEKHLEIAGPLPDRKLEFDRSAWVKFTAYKYSGGTDINSQCEYRYMAKRKIQRLNRKTWQYEMTDDVGSANRSGGKDSRYMLSSLMLGDV